MGSDFGGKENEIVRQIVDATFKIYTTLDPGLLESVWEVLLAHALSRRGLKAVRQLPVPVTYEGIQFDHGFRLDLLVRDKVVGEIKAIDEFTGLYKKQLLTYLRLTD